MAYADVFKNLDSRTVEATKKLIKNGLWKAETTTNQKVELCQQWMKDVAEVYKVEVPEFKFDDSEVMYRQTGGGYYEPYFNRITLFKKFSLTTLMHEFRHHMQHQKKEMKLHRNDIEEDARAWSCSLFKIALPKSYENAVRKGILHFN